ncbi:TetR/AcrR family transcriptional regulator [Paenibacillus sp. GSMTC-2017]|uniref:TetR/AcrR family transcriptional regulator n=1 Tax=Paenibacillus sp. GSMTC-2017 TaxID=2794350 RepID=UPI0018D90C2D|nr:TetR/AcrR family transcriptional regulator [Paenibacillus sp. GSMTC-2017]MBH5318387.1 TetR/AcrR family transcriptional regulator [Paenibacillus sp. GSMTC-2017]
MPTADELEEKGLRKGSRNRSDGQKAQLRSHILHTATEMFVELGYHDFSMRKLAMRVGCSAATLYLYFHDKDDLLFTSIDNTFTLFRNQLADAAIRSNDPWERLSSLAEAYVHFGINNPAYYRLMFMWRVDYLNGSQKGENNLRVEAFQVLADTVTYAIEHGAMQPGDPIVYSDVLWSVMHGIVALAIQIPGFDEQRTENLTELAKMMIYKAFHQ